MLIFHDFSERSARNGVADRHPRVVTGSWMHVDITTNETTGDRPSALGYNIRVKDHVANGSMRLASTAPSFAALPPVSFHVIDS